ncbi:MAG: 3D-(3,5/4)-trihydroxycyclohexane-1,2-dione acylhydrolase (decyclizing) [Steroidobacterales bacterium]
MALSTRSQQYVRLTMAQALVRHLTAQRIVIDGREQPLFGGVFAIFGHGNVICLGEALHEARAVLPTWRGQNEQSMGFAAAAYAKAHGRRRICVATSSVGPGATNMVTAAAVAHTNRLPVLFLSGDTFNHRLPHPILQQVEHFGDPTVSVNDAFKPVTRYWDRITHPAQLIQSLPAAIATMLDPGDCGPAFIGLPQDVQGIAYDYPQAFLEPRVHHIRRVRPDVDEVAAAAARIRRAQRPVIIAGGGVHYSAAASALGEFATRHNIPVVETIAGMASLVHAHPFNFGTVGVTGTDCANGICADTDLIIAIGTRLQDFTTGSWTVFQADAEVVGLNAARFDAIKHRALPVVGDALEGLQSLDSALAGWCADARWSRHAGELREQWNNRTIARSQLPGGLPSYAELIVAVNRLCADEDRVITAAGGLPAEVAANWRARSIASLDIEFGYSCMGYEIAGGWGARIAQLEQGRGGDTIVFVGDGSYLLLNSDIYSSVLSARKLIVILCDNGGFAVIDKLQRNTGNVAFNNYIADSNGSAAPFAVDFAMHARSMGAQSETVTSVAAFEAAFARARSADRTYLIEVKVDPYAWTEGGHAWWDIGTPQVSNRAEVLAAGADVERGRARQRRGV